MKTLMIICSLFFAGTFSSVNDSNVVDTAQEVTTSIEEAGPTISITLDIGRKKKDCTGIGICSIEIDIDLDFELINGNSGGGIAEKENNRFKVNLMKSTMTVETMSKYFSNGTFVVEEDFELPRDVVKQLRLSNTVVTVGTYQVTDRGQSLEIVF